MSKTNRSIANTKYFRSFSHVQQKKICQAYCDSLADFSYGPRNRDKAKANSKFSPYDDLQIQARNELFNAKGPVKKPKPPKLD